jgi:hypothetical protein
MAISKLHSQIEEWRKRLLDLSKRNRLINCKIGARAAIEVAYPEPEGVWQRVVVSNGRMTFAWKRDLLDEEDDDGSGQLSLFYEEGNDTNTKLGSLFDEPILQAWKTLRKCFPSEQSGATRIGLYEKPLVRLGEWLQNQAQVVNRLQEWIRFRETEQLLHRLNVLPVLHEVLNGEFPCEEAAQAFLARFYRVSRFAGPDVRLDYL